MSIVSNPLIGKARQKIGGAVFSSWKGLQVLKTKPLTVANPRTDNQVMRRSALEQMVHIFRLISAAIQLGFKEQAVHKSEYNAFVGEALRNSFDYSAPPVATLVPADLMTSKGTISPRAMGGITASVGAGTIEVAHDTTASGPGQSTTDFAQVVAYNSTLDEWAVSAGALPSTSAIADMNLPAGWVLGNSLDIWLSFYNVSTGKSSDSTHASAAVVA